MGADESMLTRFQPCQSLFVAPCSHTWHYKCIRSLIASPSYPIFICPNCRAAADLEAEVDDASEEWEQLNAEEMANSDEATNGSKSAASERAQESSVAQLNGAVDMGDVTVRVDLLSASNTPQNHQIRYMQSDPVPIPSLLGSASMARNNRTPSPENGVVTNGHEGPITPRNDAGPWVFDGSAGEGSSPTGPTSGGMRSIDSAAVDVERRP
jgi:hypothetical protein